MMKNIKDYKIYLIFVGGLLVIVLGFKIIELIRDTGLVENKDKEIGELKTVKETYKQENKDLYKKIKLIKETKKIDDKIISKTIITEKKIEKHFNKIKQNTKHKIKRIKKISKTVPKNISAPKIVVNRYIYREAGKVIINDIWNAYYSVKDVK